MMSLMPMPIPMHVVLVWQTLGQTLSTPGQEAGRKTQYFSQTYRIRRVPPCRQVFDEVIEHAGARY